MLRWRVPLPRGLEDIAPALSALPLFPLPQTVLFPGALLPLHIFEPRYRTMVREALETHQTLCVTLVTSALPVDSHGHPEIARVAGVGVIVDHVELPGGRFNILLRGRARVALDELPFEAPYRRARAEVLVDEPGPVDPSDVTLLLASASGFAALVRDRDPTFELRLPKEGTPSMLADLSAHQLLLDVRERQVALETLDVGARVRRVAEVIALQRLALSPDRGDMN